MSLYLNFLLATAFTDDANFSVATFEVDSFYDSAIGYMLYRYGPRQRKQMGRIVVQESSLDSPKKCTRTGTIRLYSHNKMCDCLLYTGYFSQCSCQDCPNVEFVVLSRLELAIISEKPGVSHHGRRLSPCEYGCSRRLLLSCLGQKDDRYEDMCSDCQTRDLKLNGIESTVSSEKAKSEHNRRDSPFRVRRRKIRITERIYQARLNLETRRGPCELPTQRSSAQAERHHDKSTRQ